ncbi:hypothetical protein [Ligilactobacillus animalis]|uniref:hypothetical protein n=1 Tax=Ligilactobacillus animalis TaxID=1605 RepID=UPI002942A7F2|nr:hypothetical protein [Ligilactobacillus animalis]
MNKITKLSVTALLTTFLLAGCTSQSDDSKANSNSKSKSEKLAKESSKKKAESKHKASESEKKASKASAEAESESKVSEAQSSSEQSMASDQQQAQQAPSQTQQQASEQTVSYGDLPPFDGTLSDFVNKYGVTPVVYKVQHYGMSIDEALKSTPDKLQTSGEIQTEAGY